MSEGPRVLRREDAARYCGLTESKFGKLVRLGRLPKPLPFGNPHVWDKRALDAAIDRASELPSANHVEGGAGSAALRALNASKDALRHKAAR